MRNKLNSFVVQKTKSSILGNPAKYQNSTPWLNKSKLHAKLLQRTKLRWVSSLSSAFRKFASENNRRFLRVQQQHLLSRKGELVEHVHCSFRFVVPSKGHPQSSRILPTNEGDANVNDEPATWLLSSLLRHSFRTPMYEAQTLPATGGVTKHGIPCTK